MAKVFSIIGYGGIFSSILILILSFNIKSDLTYLTYIKVALAVLFFTLIIYSNFIEIGLKSPYSIEKRNAYTGGTYRIVRHPGFLWFLFLMILVVLIYRNRGFTLIAMSMVGMNFVLILVEDIFIFPKIFINYENYRKSIPFIIPGSNIIRRRISLKG
jgi:protein-S-isoprenylcysteine O-methyltransferase Ste14